MKLNGVYSKRNMCEVMSKLDGNKTYTTHTPKNININYV